MEEIGKQYKKDNLIDKTGFLSRARLYQSKFRAHTLGLNYDEYGNYLTPKDAEQGFNFYSGFGIFDAVRRRYKRYSKGLYANMLRSEHIPFNLFIPFNSDSGSRQFLAKVLNEFLDNRITSIDRIEIEYSPSRKEKYLNDKTSFDTYIEYTHIDGSDGIIGIEVKYTEQGYKLTPNSSEANGLNDGTSKYFTISEKCNLYKPGSHLKLIKDEFRQIWRNHLLGEYMLHVDSEKFKHFTSVTLFPEGNTHFIHHSKEYIKMLVDNNNKFKPITYEAFLDACLKHCPSSEYKRWIVYLKDRYIFKIE